MNPNEKVKMTCRCGCEINEHERKSIAAMLNGETPVVNIEMGKCTAERCECEAYTPRAMPPGWVVVARLADRLRRLGSQDLSLDALIKSAGVRPPHDLLDSVTLGEEAELAESLGSALLEHVAWGMNPKAAQHMIEKREADLVSMCPTCNADVGKWCVPVHDGERATGTWLHPARYREDVADHVLLKRVLAWAWSSCPDAEKTIVDQGDVGTIAASIRALDSERAKLRRELDHKRVVESDREAIAMATALRQGLRRAELEFTYSDVTGPEFLLAIQEAMRAPGSEFDGTLRCEPAAVGSLAFVELTINGKTYAHETAARITSAATLRGRPIRPRDPNQPFGPPLTPPNPSAARLPPIPGVVTPEENAKRDRWASLMTGIPKPRCGIRQGPSTLPCGLVRGHTGPHRTIP